MRIQDTNGNDIAPKDAAAFLEANSAGMPTDMLDHLRIVVSGDEERLRDHVAELHAMTSPFDEDRPFDFDKDGRWTT
jgi:hypothetical protein